jgi:Arc/MetJ-type ribon-helix-helix transcriptional regulator
MITDETLERTRGWFHGRLPKQWQAQQPRIEVDREEITVILAIAEGDDDEGGNKDAEKGPEKSSAVSEAEAAETRAGRAKAFREETRERRIEIAREAEHRFGRKVSWGVSVGERTELFTHIAVPVMTRLRQPQRQVLDTLVESGVARSRSDAVAWCVRLVGQHSDDWLAELREAMAKVAEVRQHGPAA